jgi:dihydroorotate dehydrogenase
VLRLLRERVGDEVTLVGVGGIATPADAAERLAAGADLLQAYTAFVYEGPLWPRRLDAALATAKPRGSEATDREEHQR